jgi:cell division protein FtsL
MPKRISSIRPQEDVRRGRKQENSKGWYISRLIISFVAMALLIFLAVNVRIYYNQKSEMLSREVARVERQIHEIDREIENLKKRKEELSSFENIKGKNERYRLGLRHADPIQVRRTALIRRSKNSGGFTVSGVQTVSSSMRKTASIR